MKALEPSLVEELKNDLDGFTIVGEYVGNVDYQHLVRYNQTTILFFAYVDNYSKFSFLPPLRAAALFEKYKLNRVRVKHIGNFQTIDSLYNALGDIYNSVSSETLNDGGEGSVIYLVKNLTPESLILQAAHKTYFGDDSNNFSQDELLIAVKSQISLSASKLKTLEYRIYRKIREKIKNIVKEKHPTSAREVYPKFVNELKELIKDVQLPKPLEYYHKVAEIAFSFVEGQKREGNQLKEGYIDFLEKIIQTAETGKNAFLLEDEILSKLRPYNVVFYYPPFTLSQDEQQIIIKALKANHVEQSWHPKVQLSKGIKICFNQQNAGIVNVTPHNTFFVYFNMNDQAFSKSVDIIKSEKKKKFKSQISGIAGFVKGDVQKRFSV